MLGKAQKAIDELKRETGKDSVFFLKLDISGDDARLRYATRNEPPIDRLRNYYHLLTYQTRGTPLSNKPYLPALTVTALPPDMGCQKESGKNLDPTKLYNQNKLGNILFFNEPARDYGGEGIISTALYPQVIDTDLSRNTGSLASNGVLNSKVVRVAVPNKKAHDLDLSRKLWEWCEKRVKDILTTS
ncbi:NAD(P)-binding protein [Lactarius vividus]|nr:NAD(P)-binding protein [Lactarius vividus]